jgi:hypothetical protein
MGKHVDALCEEFAQAYAQTLDAKAAYEHVYEKFDPSFFSSKHRSVGRRANNMLRRKGVKDRINEILAQRSMASESRIRSEFENIAFSKITDVLEWETNPYQADAGEGDGSPQPRLILKDSSQIPAHVQAAIKTIKQTPNGIAVEMHDKMAALQKLSITHKGLNSSDGTGDDDDVPVLTLFNTEDGDPTAQLEDLQQREDMAMVMERGEEDED